MSYGIGIAYQMPELNKFTPEQLIAYLHDRLQSDEKYILDTVNIHLIVQILHEQVHRKLITPSGRLVVRDSKVN